MPNLWPMLEEHEHVEERYDDQMCAAHNEGLWCCLDKDNPRGKLLREGLAEMQLVFDEVLSNESVAEVWVEHEVIYGVCKVHVGNVTITCPKHNEDDA